MRLNGFAVRAALAHLIGRRPADRMELPEPVEDNDVGPALLKVIAPALTDNGPLSHVGLVPASADLAEIAQAAVQLDPQDAAAHPDLAAWLPPTFADCLTRVFVSGSQERRSGPQYTDLQLSAPDADDRLVRGLVRASLVDGGEEWVAILFYGPPMWNPAYAITIAPDHLAGAGRAARMLSPRDGPDLGKVPRTRRRNAAGDAVH